MTVNKRLMNGDTLQKCAGRWYVNDKFCMRKGRSSGVQCDRLAVTVSEGYNINNQHSV